MNEALYSGINFHIGVNTLLTLFHACQCLYPCIDVHTQVQNLQPWCKTFCDQLTCLQMFLKKFQRVMIFNEFVPKQKEFNFNSNFMLLNVGVGS
jgi:hypothetical protein